MDEPILVIVVHESRTLPLRHLGRKLSEIIANFSDSPFQKEIESVTKNASDFRTNTKALKFYKKKLKSLVDRRKLFVRRGSKFPCRYIDT